MSGWDAQASGASGWDDSGVHGARDFNETPGQDGITTGGDFGEQNGVEADGDFFAGGTGVAAGGGCRNCGQDGHFARECPEPRKMGACFNCGEEGHSKAECTKPRVFKGTCRTCEKEGHMSSNCPERVEICLNCKQEGHNAMSCENKRIMSLTHVVDKLPEDAWIDLKTASDDRDITDFKEAVQILNKADPEMTYVELEKQCRERGYNIYLIAMEKEHGDMFTIVNLQGDIGKKYTVNYFTSSKPQRPNMAARWPASTEENLKRLEDAGIPMNRGVSKCNNCNAIGHTTRACNEEKQSFDRTEVKCVLCDEVGHRVRDCKQERKKPGAPKECRVCQGTDHMAKDCPNKEKRTCRNCGSEDHMAKECPEERNPATIKCRNCDQMGHSSRDCPAPKDWSRVTCSNCEELGHGAKRCTKPPKDEAGGDSCLRETSGGGDGGWEKQPPADGSGNGGWEDGKAESAAFGGSAPIAGDAGGSGW